LLPADRAASDSSGCAGQRRPDLSAALTMSGVLDPAPEWTPLYDFPMAEEWRVSLVIDDRGGAVKGSHYRDLLRNRLGDDIAVSANKTHLYLYAGSVKAAEEAGQVAQAVLEEQGRFAEVRLER